MSRRRRMAFTPEAAVGLLGSRFPSLQGLIDEDDLKTSPHIAFSLLASEMLENIANGVLLGDAVGFIDELANSGDSLLEELLVIDVLEGIAQNAELATKLKAGMSAKATAFLERVEREFFGRESQPG